jgi:cytochrome c oxidase subunit III
MSSRTETAVAMRAEEELPAHVNDTRAVLWWGIVWLIAVEATVFIALIASYFYLKFYAPEWPMGGIEKPELLMPSIATAALLVSAVPVYWAGKGIQQGNQSRLIIGLAIGLALMTVVVVIKYFEFAGKGYSWETNAYGSVFWVLLGYHTAHVLLTILWTVILLIAAFMGYFDENRNLGVRVKALYWYFVSIIWLPIFFTLYLSPYVL